MDPGRGSNQPPVDRIYSEYIPGQLWRVDGGGVFHVKRGCRYLKNSEFVYEMHRCLRCFPQGVPWPPEGGVSVYQGIVHEMTPTCRELPYCISFLKQCSGCR